PGQNRSGRSEPSHPEHDLRFELAVDRSAKRKAFTEAPQKTENRGRKRRRQSDGGQFLEAKFRVTGKCERVDFLFGHEQHHFVAAIAQRFRDGETGKEMPACSSTCNDRVHGNIPKSAGSCASAG